MWNQVEKYTYVYQLSDAFKITLYSDKNYATATAVDCNISAGDNLDLEKQKAHVLRSVISVLMDISYKMSEKDFEKSCLS